MVLHTPRGGASYHKHLAHIRGCGILRPQQVGPDHRQAGFEISIHQKAIISPDSWHNKRAHIPTSHQIWVEEHGPLAGSIEKTAYTNVSSVLCYLYHLDSFMGEGTIPGTILPYDSHPLCACFSINNRLALVHVNLNARVKIANPCTFGRHAMLWQNSTNIKFFYKHREPIKNK